PTLHPEPGRPGAAATGHAACGRARHARGGCGGRAAGTDDRGDGGCQGRRGMSMLVHGGPDARGIPAHDFSTNANACGPCPAALAAVLAADRVRYPDPAYAALRERLGRLHGVARERIVIAASASEFIRRMTAFAVRQGLGQVVVPRHGFGDYAAAAAAWGLALRAQASEGRPALLWGCEPSSPLGRADEVLAQTAPAGSIRILDRAYAPLRMAGEPTPVADDIWQLWSPNKALGMTGVRAAYAIAPD